MFLIIITIIIVYLCRVLVICQANMLICLSSFNPHNKLWVDTLVVFVLYTRKLDKEEFSNLTKVIKKVEARFKTGSLISFTFSTNRVKQYPPHPSQFLCSKTAASLKIERTIRKTWGNEYCCGRGVKEIHDLEDEVFFFSNKHL